MTVELVTPLDDLAAEIHREYARGRAGYEQAADAYFAMGHRLLEARALLLSDNAFGSWFRAQRFGFNRQWAYVLRQAAEHEEAVRAVVTSQLVTGSPNIEQAVKTALAPSPTPPAPAVYSENAPSTFSTIVVDPPWRYDNVATRGAAEDHYDTMSLDDLADLDVPADDDCHLYLWVTNGFIREGFGLLDAWGFAYKAALTWCKPQIGTGNYFRNATEHVLFAVRGKLATLAKDVPTWFLADRTRHSSKPDTFYDLVEKSSPGPYLDMFSRRRRLGWHTWGNEA